MTKEKKNNALRNNVIFIVAVLGVLGLLYAISGERSNRLPEDSTHMLEVSPEACMACHGPGMIKPRGKKHPPKDDCMKCHKRKKGAKTIKVGENKKPGFELKAVKNAPASNSPSAEPQK